ncbi:MAG: BRO family protein [Tepidisphaeraceae bacterium]|jgi:hypothetical protein
MKILPVVFEATEIRQIYDEKTETWYFSVVDIIQVLTQQTDFQAARNYWKVLKNRLRKEGSESVTECNRLKLAAADGKSYLTDVASTETLLRLVQSVPSPKAEPIKLWLAKVGYERMPEMTDPAQAIDRFAFDTKEDLVRKPLRQDVSESLVINGKTLGRFFQTGDGIGHGEEKLIAQTRPLAFVPIPRLSKVGIGGRASGYAPFHAGLAARMRRKVSRQGVPGLPSHWNSAKAPSRINFSFAVGPAPCRRSRSCKSQSRSKTCVRSSALRRGSSARISVVLISILYASHPASANIAASLANETGVCRSGPR